MPAVVASFSLSILLSSLGTIIAREAEHVTEVMSGWRRKGVLRPLFAERKSGARIYGPHEQTEANPAQPRERLENAGERHLRRSTDCLGKPIRGGLGADERRNAHGRKSRRVIRAAPR